MVHSMQMVNAGFPQRVQYGFEMVDVSGRIRSITGSRHNQKFTPNQINRIIRRFSAISPQCKHLRFIGGC
jgi:hypothetical protein